MFWKGKESDTFKDLQNQEDNPYEYYWISKIAKKQDSTITFYFDTKYTFFLHFPFKKTFLLMAPLGGPLLKQGHTDLLMLSLPF